jgi:hypothetical protein
VIMANFHKIKYILLAFIIVIIGLSTYLLASGDYRKLVSFAKSHVTRIADMFAGDTLLAKPGSYYLGHVDQTVNVDLTAAPGSLRYEWYNPRTGQTVASGRIEGGSIKSFSPPASGDFVLWVRTASP